MAMSISAAILGLRVKVNVWPRTVNDSPSREKALTTSRLPPNSTAPPLTINRSTMSPFGNAEPAPRTAFTVCAVRVAIVAAVSPGSARMSDGRRGFAVNVKFCPEYRNDSFCSCPPAGKCRLTPTNKALMKSFVRAASVAAESDPIARISVGRIGVSVKVNVSSNPGPVTLNDCPMAAFPDGTVSCAPRSNSNI